MNWSNEIIFTLHLLAGGIILLAAARLGKTWLTALIAICTVLMNIVVSKQIDLFGWHVTGGNVLYGLVFLANDVLNEHFGKAEARRAVLIGFCGGIAVIAMTQFSLWYAPNDFDTAQPHLGYLFDITAYPRIVIASMTTYLLAQMIDIRIYQWIRARTGVQKMLWLRSNASTWVSQAFDTVFFTTVGLTRLDIFFGAAPPYATTATEQTLSSSAEAAHQTLTSGVMTNSGHWYDAVFQSGVLDSLDSWRDAIVFAFIIKIGVALVDTPFLYLTTWRPLLPDGSKRLATVVQEG